MEVTFWWTECNRCTDRTLSGSAVKWGSRNTLGLDGWERGAEGDSCGPLSTRRQLYGLDHEASHLWVELDFLPVPLLPCWSPPFWKIQKCVCLFNFCFQESLATFNSLVTAVKLLGLMISHKMSQWQKEFPTNQKKNSKRKTETEWSSVHRKCFLKPCLF